MLLTFDGVATEDLFHGRDTKAARKFDKRLWPIIRRKLDMLNAAHSLEDLKSPPGNELHALKEDQEGRSAIRVNEKYRITFRFADGSAYEVRVENYH
jgi:proteic killer suppression protein